MTINRIWIYTINNKKNTLMNNLALNCRSWLLLYGEHRTMIAEWRWWWWRDFARWCLNVFDLVLRSWILGNSLSFVHLIQTENPISYYQMPPTTPFLRGKCCDLTLNWSGKRIECEIYLHKYIFFRYARLASVLT